MDAPLDSSSDDVANILEPIADSSPEAQGILSEIESQGDGWDPASVPPENWASILELLPKEARALLSGSSQYMHTVVEEFTPGALASPALGEDRKIIVHTQSKLDELIDFGEPLSIIPGEGSSLEVKARSAAGPIQVYGTYPLGLVSAGEVVLNERAAVNIVTGGSVFARDDSTVFDLLSGYVNARGSATVTRATGGTIDAYGSATINVVEEYAENVTTHAHDQSVTVNRIPSP